VPTWSGILKELSDSLQPGLPPRFDEIRRKYLVALYGHTQRNVILYAANFTAPPPNVSPSLLSIVDEDLQGIMEVVHGLKGPNLDLILHSPGGSGDAAESIVIYLRSKFKDVRVIVPQLAQSAATMIACSANRLLMGKHSFLGPTDPQILVPNQFGGGTFAPAAAIIDQFDRAVRECQDPKKLAAWIPMLSQYGPHLLTFCENATNLSKELVRKWLASYMFKGDKDRQKKAERISTWLADHRHFKSHGRHIPRQDLAARGMIVEKLEKDQQLQDLVLSVFHATTHTFSGTPAVKIIENQLGRAFIKQFAMVPLASPPSPSPKRGPNFVPANP
jgi:hypothetical protein